MDLKNYELAEQDYMAGMKYKEIAEKYNVSLNTVKSWKTRYGWDKKSVHTKKEKVCTQNEVNKNKKKAVVQVVDEVINNDKLSDLEQLFCLYYIKYFNATKAYQRINPNVTYGSAMVLGCKMMKREAVKKEISRLKQAKYNKAMLEPEDIFQKYMDIAFSDITDFVDFGRRKVEVMGPFGPIQVEDEETGEKVKLTKEINAVEFKESFQVDGTLISEVKQGKDGASVKLADRMKALEWLANHMDLATEEQSVKIEKLRAEVDKITAETEKLNPDSEAGSSYNGIPATMIIPKFAEVLFSIKRNEYLEYVFPGGRGSTKSSFVSLCVIDLLEENPNIHAVVGRQVKDTIRASVYQQIVWAIDALGLTNEYHATISPMEITKRSTGQKIYFRGADDPGKFKSIKVPFGYIGILWLEELDQFEGSEAVRKIEQSVIRGGEKAWIFKSFNPPKTINNWANKYVKVPKDTRLVVKSNYLDVPKEWLGAPFIQEAEFLKEVNPTAYENEYMGVANGTGGVVFDNLEFRVIADEEMARMDRIYRGVDWGWFPDPWAYNAMYYNTHQHILYIIDEDERRKTKNEETARILMEEHGVTASDKVVCDSAEHKSTADYKDYGLLARDAIKGPGSVEYSMKWLQSLTAIVIDNKRTPLTAEELLNYEYERDKNDEVISGYPDKDNHHIDAIRYAMEEVWRRRGQ